MKRTLTITLLGLMAVLSVSAQALQQPSISKENDRAETMPGVDQVLDRFVNAIGGQAANKKITSRVTRATIEIPAASLSGPVEIYAKYPDKFFTIATIENVGEFKSGYDGKTGWSLDPQNGLRELSGIELVQTKRRGEIHGLLDLKKNFSRMEVKGKDKVSGRDVYIVEAVPPEGTAQKLYFDTESGLLVRWDIVTVTPQGDFPLTNYFEDYREVGGVKLAFSVRFESAAGSYTIKLQEVKHNVAIDDAKFNKPS
ncbi:MAG: hypothetical protein L0229_22650 [Blastocatellia bacterium]|nr:hypothetical protein [Blastocatellia bacterium]